MLTTRLQHGAPTNVKQLKWMETETENHLQMALQRPRGVEFASLQQRAYICFNHTRVSNDMTLEISKGTEYLSHKSSNIQLCKPVFLTIFKRPLQLCEKKKRHAIASHSEPRTSDIPIR